MTHSSLPWLFAEHFCDPLDKSHPKFRRVAEQEMTLYSADDQMNGQPAKLVKIGDAVSKGIYGEGGEGELGWGSYLAILSLSIVYFNPQQSTLYASKV